MINEEDIIVALTRDEVLHVISLLNNAAIKVHHFAERLVIEHNAEKIALCPMTIDTHWHGERLEETFTICVESAILNFNYTSGLDFTWQHLSYGKLKKLIQCWLHIS